MACTSPPALAIDATRERLALTFPPGWLDAHPLSREDLLQQTERLDRVGIEMVIDEIVTDGEAPTVVAPRPKKEKKKKRKKDKKLAGQGKKGKKG